MGMIAKPEPYRVQSIVCPNIPSSCEHCDSDVVHGCRACEYNRRAVSRTAITPPDIDFFCDLRRIFRYERAMHKTLFTAIDFVRFSVRKPIRINGIVGFRRKIIHPRLIWGR